jgi:TolB protein
VGRPGAAPEDVGGIVAADLRNSGKFNPLDRSRLPQQPGSAQEVQPAAWSALGIDAVVVGQVTQNPDGSYNVAYQLVDTGGAPGTVLAQNSLKSLNSTCAMRRTLPATRYLRN